MVNFIFIFSDLNLDAEHHGKPTVRILDCVLKQLLLLWTAAVCVCACVCACVRAGVCLSEPVAWSHQYSVGSEPQQRTARLLH